MASLQAKRDQRPAGLAFIFVTLLIDVIGFGLIIPVLPKLVGQLAGGPHEHQVRTYGVLLSVYGLMQFLCAPILGNLSDRFGRRPVLLISLLFTGFDYVIQAVAPAVGWLFLGRVIAGITGASFTAATAYIADVSPPEKRSQNFGMVGAAFGLGFIVGPALGGLLGSFGPRVPFWAAAVASGVNLLYGYFVLPESLGKEHRRAFAWSNVNPFKSLSILARKKWVMMLAGTAGILWLAQQVPPSVWVLYTQYRFHWAERDNGLSLALLGVCSMIVQLWLIRVLQAKYGDVGLIWISLLFNLIGFVAMGSSNSGYMMLMSMVVWTTCFVGGPGLQSLVSQQFDETEQGAAQGALTAIQSLTGVIGPPIFTVVFGYFTGPSPVKIPGSPFFLGALFTVIAALMARWALSHRPNPATH
ncbi:TCR/Tet family MFS transporter [Fimbriimonas ginsengisoli]|uniref:Tetracycline efflux protein TetA n=1 Tax=Fimbriimonas ginsengisoli Gsoil 348 TaxID=661478 RepID=A0A068NMZ1_FIMGI|nr:tetracycline resistance MFS efflux pump [Fimbriimonas ginsengisoli]AIE84933.1 Tetracycline efflux protein TetA [Fimbriimonas ginsengisoli Gsoil 348]